MGIPRKDGQCLAVIYSNIVVLNTKRFTRYVKKHPSKKINTKKLPEKLFRAIKHQLTCPFELTSGSFLTGRRRILGIPRNHLVSFVRSEPSLGGFVRDLRRLYAFKMYVVFEKSIAQCKLLSLNLSGYRCKDLDTK